MLATKSTGVDLRGNLVIPKRMRQALGIEGRAIVVLELTESGIMVRPAKVVPVRTYSDEQRARFLLEDAIDEKSYAAARAMVEGMGLNPDAIPHERPRD